VRAMSKLRDQLVVPRLESRRFPREGWYAIAVPFALLLMSWAGSPAAAQLPSPLPIPGSGVIPPDSSLMFRGSCDHPEPPVCEAPRLLVVNQGDQTASVTYDGFTLVIEFPQGIKAILLSSDGVLITCSTDLDRPQRLRCSAIPLLSGGRVTFGTMTLSASPETLPLSSGCNNVTLTWPDGTPTREVAAAVTPAPVLASIWRLDAATQTFRGFSPIPNAPNDLVTVNMLEPVYICVQAPATLARP
jgi:hypothetical protein